MIRPLTSDGAYIASRWLWITHAVDVSEWWSCTCMLIGVAVMMKLIAA